MMEQAEQIKALRASTGLSQKKFAEKTGVPARTILSWETGDRKPPAYVIPLLRLAVLALGGDEKSNY
jgi:DNA-binding transcriptional regulator YiaG